MLYLEIFVDIVNGAYLPILRQVRLRILDEEICRNATDDYNEDRMVCAGNFDAGGVDTCQVKFVYLSSAILSPASVILFEILYCTNREILVVLLHV